MSELMAMAGAMAAMANDLEAGKPVDADPRLFRRAADALAAAARPQPQPRREAVTGTDFEVIPRRRPGGAVPPAVALALDPVDRFLGDVRIEIGRARTKFPTGCLTTLALGEEVGELCKAVLDEPAERVRAEAVQVACMAARVVLDGDRTVVAHRAEKGLDRIGPVVPDDVPVPVGTGPGRFVLERPGESK